MRSTVEPAAVIEKPPLAKNESRLETSTALKFAEDLQRRVSDSPSQREHAPGDLGNLILSSAFERHAADGPSTVVRFASKNIPKPPVVTPVEVAVNKDFTMSLEGPRFDLPGLARKDWLFAFLVCHPRANVLRCELGMRRILAIFVLLVIGSSSIAPLAFAATYADTPACCRRDGKHHCQSGMTDMAGTPADGPSGLRLSAPSCPHRSLSATTAPLGNTETPELSLPRISTTSVSLPHPFGYATQPLLRNSERGPPASR